MTTDSIGFVAFTKVVARDAFVDYFDPIAGLVRWFRAKRINYRFGVLEFPTIRASHGVLFATLSLAKRMVGIPVDGAASAITADAIASEIRTLRQTAAFYGLRKRTRLDLASSLGSQGNAALLRVVAADLQAIEMELSEIQRRLSIAEYRHSIQFPEVGLVPDENDIDDSMLASMTLADLAAKRDRPSQDPDIAAQITRDFLFAHQRNR